MNLNGVEYFYIRNAQGDITGLWDKSGNEVVKYQYDSWGKLISTTGTLASTVGAKNPYLYRGYRYDSETGLYYLQSRYYNPEWGRFINADVYVGMVGELLSSNMFAYSKNNPVNLVDPTGYSGQLALPLANSLVASAGTLFSIVLAPEALVAVAIVGIGVLAYEGYRYFTEDNDSPIDNNSHETVGPGSYTPDRELPRTKHGDPIPDSNYPHTQLGRRVDDGHSYPQAREWLFRPDGKGVTAKRDFDITDHGNPETHTKPHQHELIPNNPKTAPKGGYRRSNPMPWDPNA